MGRKPIDVFVDAHEMMFDILTTVIMIVLLVRVIGLRLMNVLGEIDTLLIIVDLLLVLRLHLLLVLRLRLLNLVLGPIHLIRLILNRCLV